MQLIIKFDMPQFNQGSRNIRQPQILGCEDK